MHLNRSILLCTQKDQAAVAREGCTVGITFSTSCGTSMQIGCRGAALQGRSRRGEHAHTVKLQVPCPGMHGAEPATSAIGALPGTGC